MLIISYEESKQFLFGKRQKLNEWVPTIKESHENYFLQQLYQKKVNSRQIISVIFQEWGEQQEKCSEYESTEPVLRDPVVAQAHAEKVRVKVDATSVTTRHHVTHTYMRVYRHHTA